MTSNKVLWPKVFGIAAIQGAITLTWVIYSLYLTKLLVDNFGFSKEFAATVLIFENALDALIEPVFGAFSDRQQQNLGTKIPLITTGIVASSVLFILIPVLVAFVSPQSGGRWLLPLLAVLWASAMAVFRSPVVSLLGQVAPASQLPQAASILTLIGQLVSACRFDVYGLIVGVGANFAFALGSISLIAAIAVLRLVYPPHLIPPEDRIRQSIPWHAVALLAAIGLSMGATLRFLFPAVNQSFVALLGAGNIKWVMTVFFIAIGLAALPAGKMSIKIGNFPTILRGLLLTAISLQLVVFGKSLVVLVLFTPFLVFGLALVFNSILPLVISLMPTTHSGLGMGTYFGGLLAANSIFDWATLNWGTVTPIVGALGAGITLLVTCVWVSQSKTKLLTYS